MLPKNSLGRKTLRKLKVYAGPDHAAPGSAAGAVRDSPRSAVKTTQAGPAARPVRGAQR